jgi:hypothetical protein
MVAYDVISIFAPVGVSCILMGLFLYNFASLLSLSQKYTNYNSNNYKYSYLDFLIVAIRCLVDLKPTTAE